MLESFADHFVRADRRRDPLVSPLYADLAGLPPLLIQAGGAEVLLDDARRFAERARGAGVSVELEVWPDMIHAWHVFADVVPEAADAIERIGRFVRQQLEARDACGHATVD
jgi:epsilon-lactone hydrolase